MTSTPGGDLRPIVLCVDDEPLVRDALSRLLHRFGAEVVTAASGLDALAVLLGGVRPAVIFTDLDMPGLGGEALMRTVREDPALATIPIVAISGRSPDARFDRYLPKPVGLEELREAFRAFCPPPLTAQRCA